MSPEKPRDPGLVNWPAPDGMPWEDSGEGGLYAFAVVPSEAAHSNCHVGEWPVMPPPDVLVSHRVRDFWASDSPTPDHDTAKRMQGAGLDPWEWVRDESYSMAFAAVVFLGSTNCSLSSDRAGDYFRAGPDDLTEAGRALYGALEAAYGVAPTLLTFLDT